ncbi:MAG: hypothetical protein HY759_04140 [Nitrospirae bacterium]|nr:hypothetical protein [Nitrospirota bacterium]MBI5194974.1 hypothetical protein [Nitrospirota bacterium]
MKSKKKAKKHPCPDCNFCQWCSDERCNMCRHRPKASKKHKKKKHKPLFSKF